MPEDTAETTARWLDGWAHLRSVRRSSIDGWPVVHRPDPHHDREIVCVDPGVEVFATLMPHVADDPHAMLTVVAVRRDPYLAVGLPAGVGWHRTDETLMTTTLAPATEPGPCEPSEPLRTRWETSGDRAHVVVESPEAIAAEGSAGVLGAVATFDRIETSPRYRRRGLGRHIVASLSAWAIGRGATHAVLAASDEGRMLYTALGWRIAAELVSVTGRLDG